MREKSCENELVMNGNSCTGGRQGLADAWLEDWKELRCPC